MSKPYNIVLLGVGGQGVITLTRILSEAALAQDLDVKTSELHGLSQRGGSVSTQVRFGEKVWSPLIRQGTANLIISLEAQEALAGVEFAAPDKSTVFLVNDFIKPVDSEEAPTSEAIKKELENFSDKVILEQATEKAKKAVGKEVLAGVELLGYAGHNELLGLKPASVMKAIEKVVPKKYLQENKKVFQLTSAASHSERSEESRG